MLQVHMPVLEPSTVLQLALFKETGPRGSKKSVMVGLLRLRLNSLTSEVDHSAELPMCASRKQGGERTATLDLNIKVCSAPISDLLVCAQGAGKQALLQVSAWTSTSALAATLSAFTPASCVEVVSSAHAALAQRARHGACRCTCMSPRLHWHPPSQSIKNQQR